MLSNAYFLAKFRFDTAENEPCKVCLLAAPPASGPSGRTRRGARGVPSPPPRGGRRGAGPLPSFPLRIRWKYTNRGFVGNNEETSTDQISPNLIRLRIKFVNFDLLWQNKSTRAL